MSRSLLAALAFGLLCLAAAGCDGGGSGGAIGFTPWPDRGDDVNDGKQDACPPQKKHPSGGAPDKIPPDNPLDKDVDGDGRKDYFEGRWKFKRGNKNLIVSRWCVERRREVGSVYFQDYFSLEIQSSLNDDETTQVPGGRDQVCPFTFGKSIREGLEPPYDQLPTRITWITGNPHGQPPGSGVPGGDNAPNADSIKFIYEIKDDGRVATGEIGKEIDGTIHLSGEFKTGPNEYTSADIQPPRGLTDAERKAIVEEFKRERAKLAKEHPELKADPPGQNPACAN